MVESNGKVTIFVIGDVKGNLNNFNHIPYFSALQRHFSSVSDRGTRRINGLAQVADSGMIVASIVSGTAVN